VSAVGFFADESVRGISLALLSGRNGRNTMKKTLLVLAALSLGACTREVETDSPGSLDTTADTTARLSVPDIDIGVKRDTLTLPTLDVRKDTIIMGRKKVEVSRPTVDVNKKP
jgi:hypothetical protein